MKFISTFLLCLTCLQLYACNSKNEVKNTNNINQANTDTMKLKIKAGSSAFTATLQSNATATAFKSLLPLTVNMVELNDNEKYVDVPHSLPTNASNPKTIQAGDVMLYGSSTLVLFYKTFSTSYNYTRIGRIADVVGLAAAVGSGNVTVAFELE